MRTIEMYMLALMTYATMTWEILQSLHDCSEYCKLLPTQYDNVRLECDCSSDYNRNFIMAKDVSLILSPVKFEDDDVYYKSVNSELKNIVPQFKEETYPINTFLYVTSKKNKPNTIIKRQQRTSRKQLNLDKLITINKELPLYLDIGIHQSTENKSMYERLQNMFRDFRYIAKKLSDCFDLHVFIFSLNINDTNPNWGHSNKPSGLSNSELLKEIKMKCNQTDNLMTQIVHEIQENWSTKKHKFTHNKNVYRAEFEKPVKPTKTVNMAVSIQSNNVNDVFNLQNKYNIKSYSDNASTIRMMFLSNNVSSNTKFKNSNRTKDSEETLKIASDARKHSKVAIQRNINASLIDTTTNIIESSIKINMDHINPDFITKYDVITSTMTQNSKGENKIKQPITETTRAEHYEGEYLIPKIITKEFPNNTIASIVDGYETFPNSDFNKSLVSNIVNGEVTFELPTEELSSFVITERHTKVNSPKNKNETTITANATEIKGHLYLLFDKKEIAAHFIQKQDRNLHLAIDGFTLCNKIFQQKENESTFMYLLCSCIIDNNVTPGLI